MVTDYIRNFSIVAHIDHGKSTLADRLLSLTGTMDAKKAVDQVLDSMDLEKERGITIKAHAVRLLYTARDGHQYTLNLIDTPGHVDFSYEVSRSLAACEGAVLIVDAAQGVEAQTLANFYLAYDGGLEIIPVLNKIDLPAADVEGTRNQITEVLGLDGDEAIAISAKHGTGVPEVLEAIVKRVPPPVGDPEAPLKALVFDSFYDSYQGVVVYIRLIDGRVRPGMRALFMSNGKIYEVQQVGVFAPDMRPVDELEAGQVGFLTAAIKRVADAKMGETITDAARPTATPCPGYRDAKPMVFAGLYPIEDTDYEGLRDALEKLRLNDSAFNFEPETSLALGYGFRCGFLGMLHLEIVQERLEREFNLSLIVTAPSVRFRVVTTQGETIEVENPAKLPPVDKIERIEEPYVRGSILVPDRVHERDLQARPGQAGRAQVARVRRQAGAHPVRLPAERDRRGLLRPAQVHLQGLRLLRLRLPRVPALRHGQARRPPERRSRGRPQRHRPPREILREGQGPHREAPQRDPPPALRGRDPGGHRQSGHRPRDRQGDGQERDGQVLRR